MPPAATSRSLATPKAGLAGHARVAVGSAAIGSQDQLAGRNRLAANVVHPRQHLGDHLHGGVDRFLRAALILHAQDQRPAAGASPAGTRWPETAVDLHQVVFFQQRADRGGFAAQADQQIAADVRMPGNAGHDAIEHLMIESLERHAAAAAVGEGHDAVDVGKIALQHFAIEPPGDVAADRGRAIDRRDHGDVVARAGPAAGAGIAQEGFAGQRRSDRAGWRSTWHSRG